MGSEMCIRDRSIKVLRPIAIKFNLVDIPSHRKQHQGQIPLIGGLTIFAGLILSALLTAIFLPDALGNGKLSILLATSGIILIMGLVDDYRNLGAKLRFAIQVAACLIMIMSTGIYVKTLGGIAGFGEVNLGIWGIPFTVLAVVGFINALNMMDGIDGLAGGIALMAIFAILVFQFASGTFVHLDKLLLLAVVIIPYMASNLGLFGLKKIFLGDAGSMLIGYLIAWTIIILTQASNKSVEPISALWCVAIPLLDMWAVMFKRIIRGLSPFGADRGHLHHLFMIYGVGSRQALVYILSLAACLVAVGLIATLLLPSWSFYIFLSVIVIYTVLNHIFDIHQPKLQRLDQAKVAVEKVELEAA